MKSFNAKMTKNLLMRLLFVFTLLIPVFYFQDFYQHFYVYLTGNVITNIITQEWHIVLLSILLFLAVLIPLSFRRRVKWAEYGLVSAFFISLFVEMYGIPLTIFLASKYFLTNDVNLPNNIIEFDFLGVGFGMDLAMVYALFLMILGVFFVTIGWVTLYRNIKKDCLVTKGIYKYSRHPQYLGFILIVMAWFIGWPTILTLILTPILIYKYVSLCKTEEGEILDKSPRYIDYKNNVPFFI